MEAVIAVPAMASAAVLALVASAVAEDRPYDKGPVWQFQEIMTKPGDLPR